MNVGMEVWVRAKSKWRRGTVVAVHRTRATVRSIIPATGQPQMTKVAIDACEPYPDWRPRTSPRMRDEPRHWIANDEHVCGWSGCH